VGTKLKTISNALYFQQSTLNGIIYAMKGKQNSEGVLGGKNMMMTQLGSSDIPDEIEFGDDAENAIQSFDMPSEEEEDTENREYSNIGEIATKLKTESKKKKKKKDK
jgi:hypothetical protein